MKKIVILGVSVVVGLAAFAVVSSASSFNSGKVDFDRDTSQHHERPCAKVSNGELSLNRERHISRRDQMMGDTNAAGEMKNDRRRHCQR